MDDALPAIEGVVELDAEVTDVLGQRFELRAALGVVDPLRAVRGLHVVIDDGQRLGRGPDLATGRAKALESLGARDFVHEMAVDVEKAGAVRLNIDDVVVPDLVVEGARAGHGLAILRDGLGAARTLLSEAP